MIMVQEIAQLLPKDVATSVIVMALLGTLFGASLWLIGARFSRSMITLLLVAVGAGAGLMLPKWCGWAIDGWVTAIGGSLILGASGFFMHRFWVAVGLGLVVAAWVAVPVWVMSKGPETWSPPKHEAGTTAIKYSSALWQSVPATAQRYLPAACAIAVISGIGAALMWPRIGIVLLYSMTGVTLLVGLGLFAMNAARPQWIGSLPARPAPQALILFGMVAFGAVLQWRIAPSKNGKKQDKGKPNVTHD
jgi:hypothetical protein